MTAERKRLFELVGVLVAIALVGSAVRAGVRTVGSRVQEAQRLAAVAHLRRALELHVATTGAYPIAREEACVTGTDPVSAVLRESGSLAAGIVDPEAPDRLPDIGTPHCIAYASADGRTYVLRYVGREGETTTVTP